MTLQELKDNWVDEPNYHKMIHETFIENVNNNHELNLHRNFIQDHVYGFGERSFWWLWKIILDELKENGKKPNLLEIGCFKGATLSVWKLLNPFATVYGVTPLDSTGIDWEGDYLQFIKDIHVKFGQPMPTIIHGLSESKEAIETAKSWGDYDVVYIDGGHERRHIDNDLQYYAPMVKVGGYLVIDDCANDLNMIWGYFQGIADVTNGVVDYMSENGDKWEFITNVVHIKVYKRIS